MATGTQEDLLRRIRLLETATGTGAGSDTTVVTPPPPTGFVELAGHDNDVGQSVAGPLQIASIRNITAVPTGFGGSPLVLQQDNVLDYTDSIFGPVAFTTWTNPWFAAEGVTGNYGTVPQGPRGNFSLEGTTTWNRSGGLEGGPNELFTAWYVYKNAPGVAATIGGNVMWELTYQAMADGAHIGVATIPDVQAPNIASEYARTSFSGWWGYIDNPWFGTLNGGQLDAPTAESVGFMGLAMFMGDTQWGSRTDFMVREAWMSAGVQGQTAITPTLDTHVGMYMEPLTAATTNISMVVNNGIQAFDKNRTFTAAPFSGLGGFVPGGVYHSFQNKFTLNFANAAMGALFGFQGTVEVSQTANSLGLMAHYLDGGTYQNTSGVVAHLNDVDFLADQPTFKANNATIHLGHPRFALINPTFTVVGTGTFDAFSQWTDIESNSTVAAGALLTNRFGYRFNDASTGAFGSHRITNQYALYIPILTGADNNYGIYNASTTMWPSQTATLSAAGSQIAVVSTAVLLNNTSGGALTLTSVPTIPAGVSGEYAILINESANAVTIQDNATLVGSLVQLADGSTTRTLTQWQSMVVRYSATAAKWIEVGGRASNLALTELDSPALAGGGSFVLKDFGSNSVALNLYKTAGDTQAMASLSTVAGFNVPGVYFGPGGSTAADVDFHRTGTAAGQLTGQITIHDGLTMADAKNIVLNASTGTQLGTGTTQKLGIYGATPVAQQAAAIGSNFTAGAGTAMNSASTSTGGTGSSAYTFADLVRALKNFGLLAT